MEKGKIGGIRTPNSETPEPIVTQFGMGDYVGDMTQQASCLTPFKPVALWVKYHSRVVFNSFKSHDVQWLSAA